MKKITLIFLTLFFLSANAQEEKIFESKNVTITAQRPFDAKKLSIILSNASETFSNIFILSENDKDYIKIDGVFPNEKGFYYLLITYEDYIYREVIWYRKNPENEKLKFYFYKSEDKTLCKITSEECLEANKDIVLYKLSKEELKKLSVQIKKKK